VITFDGFGFIGAFRFEDVCKRHKHQREAFHL